MSLLGDFGGFNGTMIMIPSYLMSYFSFIMYKWAITDEIPVKTQDYPAATGNTLKAKILSSKNGHDQATVLSQVDVACLSH